MTNSVVSSEAVNTTIDAFLRLDKRGDHGAMNKIAQRLQREQPFLLQYGAQLSGEHGPATGEAGVFYMTLAWSMFDEHYASTLPRITEENLASAKDEVKKGWQATGGIAEKPVHERVVPALASRQPNIYAKFSELIDEDVREAAMTPETATAIMQPLQVAIEALDAVVSERRPGQRQGTIVHAEHPPGRNEPCPCGSGKKYKKCHAIATTP